MSTGFSGEDLERAERRKGLGKARSKGTLPRLPDTVELLEAWLTRAFAPAEGYVIDLFERAGKQKSDPCSIRFRNGRDTRTFRFSAQSALQGSTLRPTVLAISDGWLRMAHLTGSEQEDVWAGLCIYGRVMTEFDDREETRKWFQQLLDETRPLHGHTLVPDGRHDALMAVRSIGEFRMRDAVGMVRSTGDDWPRRPVRFIDEQTGEQYVRASEAATFIRHVCGAEGLAHATLRARLSEIGVERRYFEDYRPPHPKLTFYLLTGELVEHVEGDGGTGEGGTAAAAGGAVSDRGERMAF